MFSRRRFGLLLSVTVVLSNAASAQQALPTISIGARPSARPAARVTTPAHPRQPPPSSPVIATAPAASEPAGPTPPPITASSEKFFTGKEVNSIPFARPGEALEIVPGLVVTQHSGDGKANQYFLRGFNLDHGSDLALYLDGMPLNMRTHGHAQGYADSNFLIPELLGYVLARKGPYDAQDGDFASAGSVYLQYKDKIEKGFYQLTGGNFGYGRALAVAPYKDFAGGSAYGAVESQYYNGPWERGDNLRKINSVFRWSRGAQEDGASVTFMGYANKWYATNQIPQRAVVGGLIPLWGTLNPTDGGDTTRFSLSARWSQTEGNHASRVAAYLVRSTLDIYNDFTYFLANPNLGDQFRQFDRRWIAGVDAQHKIKWDSFGLPVETRIGLQGRYDDIRLGLQDSFRRTPYETVRNDAVGEGSISFWTDTSVRWTPWLKTIAGGRFDYYNANVTSLQSLWGAPVVATSTGAPAFLWTGPWNSGSKDAALFSPKASIILGPWAKTELFANYGEGFHSTDARGAAQRFDTSALSDEDTFLRVAPIPLLVKSRGAEIGARTKFIEGLDSSVSFFWLNLDSENQFEGDSGTTTYGRPSRRYGVEIANHYRPVSWINFDGDVALAHARYRGFDTARALAYADLLTPEAVPYGTFLGNAPGNFLQNAVAVTAMGGLELGEATGWFGAIKYRYIGSRPLTEDGFLKSPATGTVNARLGYRWSDGWRLQLDAFNIFNSRSDQITYGYGSLLPSDPLYGQCRAGVAPGAVCAIGVMDRHFKPVEPPAVRVTFSGPLNFDTSVTKLPDVAEPLRVFSN
ncbi:TonB-dependent receptor domain-containing protein [Methylocystis sp. Sn-Cys]|uniref:TonB-dependent receptor domain-containing protein n=1 Tax=Methylocystis sp. Sn-Cys TaxID=1701263 RepID=UPI0019242BE5|nr:TonB-dependent receptor [Methylocystis sp. Sn-Cys]MBL1257627.1 TonB-dependent receptor [Methylocystis sp. Sn-Cys]